MNHEERIKSVIKLNFKTSMIKSNLCGYNHAYIHAKGTITVRNTGTAAAPHNRNKKVIFKNCAPFTNYICEINNEQEADAYNIDVIMPIYNLTELMTLIRKHQEFYGNTIEMKQF